MVNLELGWEIKKIGVLGVWVLGYIRCYEDMKTDFLLLIT